MLVLATIACVSGHLHLRSMPISNQTRVALAACSHGCKLVFWRRERVLLASWTRGRSIHVVKRDNADVRRGEIESSHPQYVHGARTHKAVQNT